MRAIPAILACAAALALAGSGAAWPATRYWVGPNNAYWNNDFAWADATSPLQNDTTVLGTLPISGVLLDATVNFDGSFAAGAGLNFVRIDGTAIPRYLTFQQTSPISAMVAGSLVVGDTVLGNFYNQGAGSNRSSLLTLGQGAGGGGTYTLYGSATLTADSIVVGGAGQGSFAQSGGQVVQQRMTLDENSIGGRFALGAQATAQGDATLGGGSLTGFRLVVGELGMGSFAQSGGTHAPVSAIIGGGTPASPDQIFNPWSNSGTYAMSGGSLIVGGGNGQLDVGLHTTGIFTQSAGLVTAGTLGVGGPTDGVGRYTLTGGTLNVALLSIGERGSGEMRQQGGALSATGGIVLGAFSSNLGPAGGGAFILTGGAVTTPSLLVGGSGIGRLYQDSGSTLDLGPSGRLDLGRDAGGSGSFRLDGGSTFAAQVLAIGADGSGLMQQSSGMATVATLFLGGSNTGQGRVELSGGQLTVGNAARSGALRIGAGGSGTLVVTGGALSVTGPDASTVVGDLAGSNGSVELHGGVFSAPNLTIGRDGAGSFLQSGGQLLLVTPGGGGTLTIGSGAGNGSFVVGSTSGAAVLRANTLLMPDATRGRFEMSAGSDVHVDSLRIGSMPGAMTATPSIVVAGGTLSADTGEIGVGGSAAVLQSDGEVSLSGRLVLGGNGTAAGSYTLSGGTLSAPTLTVSPGSTLVQSGGIIYGTIVNHGAINFSGGQLIGSLDHQSDGVLTLSESFRVASTLTNRGIINVPSGLTLAAGLLDNENLLTLTGGALTGSAIVNDGTLTGNGRIFGNASFANNGIVSAPGLLNFANTGTNTNNNLIYLDGASHQLQLTNGATLDNLGTLYLGGAMVSGDGTLFNRAGGTVSNGGIVLVNFVNQGVVVPNGETLSIFNPWSNEGVVQLGNALSVVTGGKITNTGTIQGAGTVGAALLNRGTVEAVGGTLILAGTVTNSADGLLAAGSGAKLLAQGGVATNAGLVSLSGGTFDNGGKPLANSGQISGYGTLRSGGLTNTGTLTLANGVSTVNGALINAVGGHVTVAYGSALFTGPVTNQGQFKTTSANVTFAGGFTNSGVYVSDPSVQNFTDLVIAPDGALVGGAGDVFRVSGKFINQSTNVAAWNTRNAALVFNGSGTQQVVVAGRDLGAGGAGAGASFSWGSIELMPGVSLDISGNTNGSALYTGLLILDGGLAQLASIHSSVNLYYDVSAGANAYLLGANYGLAGGGALMAAAPVPEPEQWALWLAGLGMLARRAQRKGASCRSPSGRRTPAGAALPVFA